MKLKRFIIFVLCFSAIIFIFSGCSDSDNEISKSASTQQNEENAVPAVLQPTEYTLYQNIFINNQGKDYDNTSVTKKGTFTVIYDEYNSVIRYYVWGFNDQTKCCDWQWEFVPVSEDDLPLSGSLVEITGTFKASENALDGYWIENADISVLQKYNNNSYDIDMTTMSGTLERVQVANIQNFPEKFEGKTICAYGRIETISTLQHPYYDNCFSLEFESEDESPAIGKTVTIGGKYSNSKIINAEVKEDAKYNQAIV